MQTDVQEKRALVDMHKEHDVEDEDEVPSTQICYYSSKQHDSSVNKVLTCFFK